MPKKNILVAPLNWGIGHATRCIPIINELIKTGFNPIIASDGIALEILQKEFPKLKSFILPSYNIQYPKNGQFLKLKLFFNAPHVLKAIKKERRIIQNLVQKENLIGIISDNRLGVRSDEVSSVFITHQLNVLSGWTTFFTSKIHQSQINKFDVCWIPDTGLKQNLAGKLALSNKVKNQRFIGVLSRFEKKQLPVKYDLLVLLSGIEPSRIQLEKKLISELKHFKGKVLFVKGIIEEKQQVQIKDNITFHNFLLTDELEKAINISKLVIARSGYSTIMDLAILNKKVFFIPTTGQSEQEYLAQYLEETGIAPFSSERKFKISLLREIENYNGFEGFENTTLNNLAGLFDLFHSK